MKDKSIKLHTQINIDVWPALGETEKQWCYKVSLCGMVDLAHGNNFATEKEAYQMAVLNAAAYKSQLEA
jgi:hypothetical protein